MNFMADGGGSISESEAVEIVLKMLNDVHGNVGKGEHLHPVPAGSFGGAPTAVDLGSNTSKAHSHVVQAMSQMAAALQTYTANVEHFRKDVHETDDDIASFFHRTTQAVDCSGTVDPVDTFHNTQQCTLPENH
jgi:hypothetical protein